ncbi:MAG: hypothetical protein MN733_38225 [Nitrososphaera sp.]|nr:hypothetical protein [Nitrososphaera sp.]
MYAYVRNRPVSFFDPWGLDTEGGQWLTDPQQQAALIARGYPLNYFNNVVGPIADAGMNTLYGAAAAIHFAGGVVFSAFGESPAQPFQNAQNAINQMSPFARLGWYDTNSYMAQLATAAAAFIPGGLSGRAGKVVQTAEAIQAARIAAQDFVDVAVGTAVQNNKAILGRFPAYRNLGLATESGRFDLPESIWNALADDAERWLYNQKFLDGLAKNRVVITLATPYYQAQGTYLKELNYMSKLGYRLSQDARQLLPPRVH